LIRVLVVDDSAVMRTLLRAQLERASDIEVVGEAADPYEARVAILQLSPDVITLDIDMPRMDGLSFLARLMRHHPLPVVVVSSLTPSNSDAALRALSLGAVEVIAKPNSAQPASALRGALTSAVRAAACARVRVQGNDDPACAAASAFGNEPVPLTSDIPEMIAIGASTGGPAAIERVLSEMPAHAPPIVIVQHMLSGFTSAFARRLNERCAVRVKEARDGEPAEAGTAVIAPSGQHMLVLRHQRQLRIALRAGPPVQHHRPSVDVLFHSVAEAIGARAVAVLLTGMGADGASGMCALRAAGARTIAQDATTSVVFSMPGEAIRSGGACQVLPLQRIAAATLQPMRVPHAAYTT
jgi:two-component system chemotaxis response regulator CheB